jgi:hypothetical protein
MINKLTSILSPPTRRTFDTSVWATFESKKNLRLPNDFKELISIYGCGAINDFLWLLDPFSKNQDLNFEKSRYFIDAYAVMKEDFASDYPRPKYPARESFFPWAVTDNGETFVWLIDGEPNSWTVAIHSSDQSEEEIYNYGCVEFLFRLLSNEISSKILPSQFPPADLTMRIFMTAE